MVLVDITWHTSNVFHTEQVMYCTLFNWFLVEKYVFTSAASKTRRVKLYYITQLLKRTHTLVRYVEM